MAFVRTPSLEIEYEEYGDPSGSPVLLLHGFPDCLQAWRGVVRELLGDGGAPPRLLAPNVRAYGRTRLLSGEPTGQTAALATDALEFLDALGVERAMFVGHDWGARTAYASAVLAPARVSGVVALATAYTFPRGPVPALQQGQAWWYQWLFQLELGEQVLRRDPGAFGEYLWRAWSPGWEFTAGEIAEAREAWKQPDWVAVVLSYYRSRHGNGPEVAQYAHPQKKLDGKPPVPVPVWYMQGLADACELPESAAEGLEQWCPAGFEQSGVSGAGHFLPREAPIEVARLVRRALAGR